MDGAPRLDPPVQASVAVEIPPTLGFVMVGAEDSSFGNRVVLVGLGATGGVASWNSSSSSVAMLFSV